MTLNIFNTVSFVLFISAIIKVYIGLFYHDTLYAYAKKAYSSPSMSLSVKILMLYALSLLIAIWIGTIFYYQANGWILTSFLTIASIKLFGLMFHWKKASKAFVLFIEKKYKQLWFVDVIVLMLGLTFLALGLLVYTG